MMEMQRQRQQNGGPLTGRMFPDILDAEGRPVNTLMHAKAAVLEPLRQAGLLDPAFYYAAIKVDFVLKGYWPEGLLPKNEMRKRMEEVNAAVDEYIALGTDPRPALEIERAAKVAADGGPLYRRCAACGSYEEAHGQYKTCSSCKAVRYCGADCQASHWKAGHKRACKSGPAKEVCRSQLAYSLAAEAVAMGIMGPPLALYVQQKLADMERAAAGEAAGSGAAAAAPAAGTSGE